MLRTIFNHFGKRYSVVKRPGCNSLSECSCKRYASIGSLNLTSDKPYLGYELPSPPTEHLALPSTAAQNSSQTENVSSSSFPTLQSSGAGKNTDVKSSRNSRITFRYHMLETLGKGSHSKVKLAHNITTGKDVAIKIIKPAWFSPNFFLREASVMPLMDHPNIVKWHHNRQSRRALLFVVEYADGGSLKDLLKAKWCLDEEYAKNVFEQLVDALRYCHMMKITHGDLKPSNILFTADGTVKLADFGYSAEYLMSPAAYDPRYLAPEVLKNKMPGPKSDVWSLGVILHQMLAGTTPFSGLFPADVLRSITEKDYVAPFGVSTACKTLLNQLLVEDPDSRPSLHMFALVKWLIGGKSLALNCKTKVEESSQKCRFCTFYRLMGRTACTFKHVLEIRANQPHQMVPNFPICSRFHKSV